MIILGLTGSIGMGKSVAAKMLGSMGCPVHDSDLAAHQALSPKGAAFEAVAVMFPQSWDAKRHVIDRRKLGEIVFADAGKLRALEQLVHPAVLASQKKFLVACMRKGADIAVLDIPLLFETQAERRVDYTICVTARPAIQRRRVLSRPNMSPEKFDHIIASQIPDRIKRRKADFVVETGLGYAVTYRRLQEMIDEVRK